MIGKSLKVVNLQHSYAEDQMKLDLDISFHVGAGEVLGVMGSSGCGKSTLCALIAGFLKPQKGHIILGENEVTYLPPGKRQIASLFQGDNLFNHLSVLQNMKFAGKHVSEEAILQHLADVGLTGFEKRVAGNLSGGEKQRVALARLMLQQVACVIIDEGFAALGPAQRIEIAQLLRKLQAELGFTILCISHDVTDMQILTDNIVFMFQGKIHYQGSLKQAIQSHSDPVLHNYFNQDQ